MNGIKVSMDTVRFSKKPEKWDVANISNRIGSGSKYIDAANIKSFAKDVGGHGMSFAPASFKNNVRKVDTFEQIQLFALDFDNGTTLAEVQERARKYDLPMLFAYETLTSTNQNKFRVAFLNNTPIDDVKLAEINQHALMEIFPEADKSCKDVARMYFGGKKLLYFDDSLPSVDTEMLLRNMTLFMMYRRGPTHYKTHIRKFANKHNIKLNKRGLLDIVPIDKFDGPLEESRPGKVGVSNECENGKKSPKSFIIYTNHYNKEFGEILPNLANNKNGFYYCLNLSDGHQTTSGARQAGKNSNHKDYRANDLQKIMSSCRLYQEFALGERRLHHGELFGIATNLRHVETGESAFRKILSRHPEHYDSAKREIWDIHLKYNNENDYHPESCEKYCPHNDTCNHTANILTTAKPKQGTLERLSGYEENFCEDTSEAHEDLRQKLIEAIRSEGAVWHVIKAQTAVGKTFAYLHLAKELDVKFLMVVPTNVLKRELQLRAERLGIPVGVSPSLDEIKDQLEPYVWKHISRLRSAGLFSQVYPYINGLRNDGNKVLKEYLDRLYEFKDFEGHAITTHRRFLNMDENELKKYDVIIIDEDILLSCIATDQCNIPISTLQKMLEIAEKKSSDNPTYKALVMKIKNIFKNIGQRSMFKLDVFEWDVGVDELPPDLKKVKYREWCEDSTFSEPLIVENEEVEGISALTDIPSFCWAEHFLYRKASEERDLEDDCITFLRPFKFKDIKCIMVSATANKSICEYVFGDDKVKFYECKKARIKGKLYQYYDQSMSREYISKNPDIFDKIKKWTGFEHTITYKKYAKKANSNLWFGNLAGIDNLKGQNINVVGTNNRLEFVYKLLPKALGLDFDHEAKMKYIPIERNGYLFHFMTFEDEVLREFHLWMIESDLEQAVGRARLLRHDCVVNLFSNYPLEQAVMRKFDSLENKSGIKSM